MKAIDERTCEPCGQRAGIEVAEHLLHVSDQLGIAGAGQPASDENDVRRSFFCLEIAQLSQTICEDRFLVIVQRYRSNHLGDGTCKPWEIGKPIDQEIHWL